MVLHRGLVVPVPSAVQLRCEPASGAEPAWERQKGKGDGFFRQCQILAGCDSRGKGGEG